MKVLILYVYGHHHTIVERLSDEMLQKGIVVDVLNVTDYNTYMKSNLLWYKIFGIHKYIKKDSIAARLFSKIFFNLIFPIVISNYDRIDFHAYCPIFYKPASICRRKKIKYDITLWGSEILRADSTRLQLMEDGFQGANKIKSAKSVLKYMSSTYSGRFDDKLYYADFGNSQFEHIDNISDNSVKLISKKYYSTCLEKILITCGYNGAKCQNHIEIIRALGGLSQNQKQRVHLLIPLTYECPTSFIDEIRQELNRVGIPYTIFTKYMDKDENAVLRKLTDIVINIQNTDAFSFSLQEHLYCGNILILGEWLNYPELEESSIFLIRTEKDELTRTIENTLINFPELKKKCISNKNEISKIISWSAMADRWEHSYLS